MSTRTRARVHHRGPTQPPIPGREKLGRIVRVTDDSQVMFAANFRQWGTDPERVRLAIEAAVEHYSRSATLIETSL